MCIYHRAPNRTEHDVFVIRKSKYLVKDEGKMGNMKRESATATVVASVGAAATVATIVEID